MFEKHTILGVHITDRLKDALEVQRILTQHGNQVKTRLGLHEIDEAGKSGKNGLLILEMVGPDEGIRQMADKLNALDGIEVQSMVFKHTD
ncbi:MAG TPA: hypothetical protein PKK48_03165 [Phycisphaerae bacterium]|nr:hypothetical protein [Phycisphaerae bacterium]HPS53162.1 hypothetical protein [Phycisphaerae bacterium]